MTTRKDYWSLNCLNRKLNEITEEINRPKNEQELLWGADRIIKTFTSEAVSRGKQQKVWIFNSQDSKILQHDTSIYAYQYLKNENEWIYKVWIKPLEDTARKHPDKYLFITSNFLAHSWYFPVPMLKKNVWKRLLFHLYQSMCNTNFGALQIIFRNMGSKLFLQTILFPALNMLGFLCNSFMSKN